MQRVNRLLMLRARNLVGPFFQRVGASTYARSAGNYISATQLRSASTITADFTTCGLDAVAGGTITAAFTACSLDAVLG